MHMDKSHTAKLKAKREDREEEPNGRVDSNSRGGFFDVTSEAERPLVSICCLIKAAWHATPLSFRARERQPIQPMLFLWGCHNVELYRPKDLDWP
ncbi:hypothetical protein TNCT_700861 [Trichonephila clavata]|uniref:Uncharacterized protein n=1 Tax=Trichonephila clavata TaxID=2740835 RepID=A0A8X6H2K1_TRICU|nr:hypothetical protein TNCT_700861 [Trichonephila clavata]